MTEIEHDIAYGTQGQTLDIYRGDGSAGTVIVLHGGGWYKGDKAKDADLGQAFADAGYVAVVPNYRLAPAATFPAQIDDVLAVLDWVRISLTDADVERVAVFGSSAGGNLAMELAARRGIPAAIWSGLIDLAGTMTLTEGVEPQRPADADPDVQSAPSATINQGGRDDPLYRWAVLNLLGDDTSRLADATVLDRITDQTGPVLLVNSLDELVPAVEVVATQRALIEAGIPHETIILAGQRHAKGYKDDVWAETLQFLSRALAR